MKKAQLTEKVRAIWPELVKADEQRNGGSMPMELFSVEGYAQMDGVTPEQYIVNVLRLERERRTELDRILRDKELFDNDIEAAAVAGVTITQYLADHMNSFRFNQTGHVFRPEDIAPHYLREVIKRMEERARGASKQDA